VKALSDKTLDVLEEVALEGAKHMKACLAYEGDNPRFYLKAKIGAAAVNGFVKARCSETARMAIVAMVDRQGRIIDATQPKKLLKVR
jgi:hypothetical protein